MFSNRFSFSILANVFAVIEIINIGIWFTLHSTRNQIAVPFRMIWNDIQAFFVCIWSSSNQSKNPLHFPMLFHFECHKHLYVWIQKYCAQCTPKHPCHDNNNNNSKKSDCCSQSGPTEHDWLRKFIWGLFSVSSRFDSITISKDSFFKSASGHSEFVFPPLPYSVPV